MTNDHEPDAIAMVRKLRYDLTAMQAKVTDILEELARLNLPAQSETHKCPKCGITRPSEHALKDHLELIHPQ